MMAGNKQVFVMRGNVRKTSVINHIAFFSSKRGGKKERPKCLLDLRYYTGLNLPKFWNEFRLFHIIFCKYGKCISG